MNQLDRPAAGETVAVMHTGMGDIAIRLFPEKAPKAVENFTTHAKKDVYKRQLRRKDISCRSENGS